MKIFSCNFRGASRRGVIYQVREFINDYHPDIIVLLETKMNSNRAKSIIQNFSLYFPFFIEIPLVGFTGGLWVL